ncbi:GTP 3',8-cyclase MoaA, partial [Burkholderia multivorans]
AELPRRPFLDRVLAGIDGAKAAGLDPVKINAVLLPGLNDHQAPDLLQWCLENDLSLRFIEQMPLDAGHSWQRSTMITAADVFALLEPRFVLTPDSQPR